MSGSVVTYARRPEATPEAEVSALANVFRYVLDSHANKEAAPESRPDAAKEIKNDSRPLQSTP